MLREGGLHLAEVISKYDGLDIIRDIYRVTKEPDPADFYRHSNMIPLGTYQQFDNYEDINKLDPDDFHALPYEEVTNMILASDPGTYKTTIMKRLIVYYHFRGYRVLIVDAKSNDMRYAKKPDVGFRLPGFEIPVGLPLHTCVPSYVTSRSKGHAAVPEAMFKGYDERFTLPSSQLTTQDEWQTVLGSTETGAEIMKKHIMKAKNINKVREWISKDYKLNVGAKNSLLLRLGNIIEDNVFDAKYHGQINLEEIWNAGKIPMVSFFRQDPNYQKITVAQLLKQEWEYSMKYNHRFNIINFWDDCQMYFDSDKHNYANEMVANTIDYGRTYKFNNVFSFQKPKRFSDVLIESARHFIIGYLQNPEAFSFLGSEAMMAIEDNKYHFNSYNRGNIEVKNVRYAHIPQNVNMIRNFYPLGSICGHFKN